MNRLHTVGAVTVQRSSNGVSFTDIGNISMIEKDEASFADNLSQTGNYYYRLKITDVGGNSAYSNILVIKNGNGDKQVFKAFPTVVNSYTTVNFNSSRKETAQLMLADNMGRIVSRQPFELQTGVNTSLINGLERLPAGSYIVLIKGSDFSYNQKVVISH
jgi:hypothetical protein